MTESNNSEVEGASIDQQFQPRLTGSRDPFKELSTCKEYLQSQRKLKAPNLEISEQAA
jgi:hypothetical protein